VKPNFVVIVSDEHDGGLLGAAGHARVRTPHLDGLAASGTLFERAYCAGPVCVPSRLSRLTGRTRPGAERRRAAQRESWERR